jgi:hypothetical protein
VRSAELTHSSYQNRNLRDEFLGRAHLRADLYEANLGRAHLSGAHQVVGTSPVDRTPYDLFFLLYDLISAITIECSQDQGTRTVS